MKTVLETYIVINFMALNFKNYNLLQFEFVKEIDKIKIYLRTI